MLKNEPRLRTNWKTEGFTSGLAFIMSGLFLVFPGLAAILRQISPLIA